MRTSARTLRWAFALAVVLSVALGAAGAVAVSRVHPRGTYRVVVNQGGFDTPFLATFLADGGIVATTIPSSCLAQGESISPGHGAWQVRLRRGVPMLEFQILSDVYGVGVPGAANGGGSLAQYLGSFRIVGSAPLLDDAVKGEATVFFPPDPCFQVFGGAATFTARQIDAVPPTEIIKN